MTDKYEDALKCFDDGCMGEHIHEWCNGDGMQQARSGVYGFEFTVEQIDTIRKALKLASVAQEMVNKIKKLSDEEYIKYFNILDKECKGMEYRIDNKKITKEMIERYATGKYHYGRSCAYAEISKEYLAKYKEIKE